MHSRVNLNSSINALPRVANSLRQPPLQAAPLSLPPAPAPAPAPRPICCFLCGESLGDDDNGGVSAAYVTYAECAHRAHFVPCAAQQLMLGFARCACRIRDVEHEAVSTTAEDYGFDREHSNDSLVRIATATTTPTTAPPSQASFLKLFVNYFAAAATPSAPPAAISSATLRAAVCACKGAAELKQRGFMLDMVARAQLTLEFFLVNRWSLIDLHALGLCTFDQLAQLGLKLRLFIEYRSLLPIDVLVRDFRGSSFDAIVSKLVTVHERADVLAQLRAMLLSMDELRILGFHVRSLMQFTPTLDDIKALHIDVESAFRDFGFNRAIYMQLQQNGPVTTGVLWRHDKLDHWLSVTDNKQQRRR